MKCLLVLWSYHHENTKRVADVLAAELGAEIKAPDGLCPSETQAYDLIGFGSGIYGAALDPKVIRFADQLPPAGAQRAFIFSTAAIVTEKKTRKDHAAIREVLESKGYTVVGDFSCPGFNTNSFLKLFGGMNRGRPNAGDLERARIFARGLKGLT